MVTRWKMELEPLVFCFSLGLPILSGLTFCCADSYGGGRLVTELLRCLSSGELRQKTVVLDSVVRSQACVVWVNEKTGSENAMLSLVDFLAP